MKNVFKVIACSLALLALPASCSKERKGAEELAQAKESVELRLPSMTASLENGEGRAATTDLNLVVGANKAGKLVPKPKFKDGEKVAVHMVLRDKSGKASGVGTLDWTYDQKTDRLVLKQTDEGNSIVVTGADFDTNSEWYVMGFIGGSLTGQKVAFMAERELYAVEETEGEELKGLKVPYVFGWTRVGVETEREKEGSSYKYGYSRKDDADMFKTVSFRPLGSVVAFKVGNSTEGSLKLNSFFVQTDAFVDNGTFDLNPNPGQVLDPQALPVLGDTDATCPIEYTPREAKVLAAGQTEAATYYAWVYPTESARKQNGAYATHIVLKGQQDGVVTNTFITDYAVKGKQLTDAKVYPLKVNATQAVRLPLEYVAENDLSSDADVFSGLAPTRLFFDLGANSRRGLFIHDWVSKMTPTVDIRKLPLTDADGSTVVFEARYRVPEHDDWAGVVPSFGAGNGPNGGLGRGWDYAASPASGFHWATGSGTLLSVDENIKIGSGDSNSSGTALLRRYSSSWVMLGSTNVIYAVRLGKLSSCTPGVRNNFGGEPARTYLPAPDNALRTAYRYTLSGQRLTIDIVHVGDDKTVTDAKSVADPAWWTARSGETISRTFNGFNWYNAQSNTFGTNWASYWASNATPEKGGHRVRWNTQVMQGAPVFQKENGLLIRPFKY